MLGSMTLLEKRDHELVYAFSEVKDVDDGRAVVNLNNISESKITEWPKHKENRMSAGLVFGKLLRLCKNGERPEKVFFAS